MKKTTFYTLLFTLIGLSTYAQTARVQVIHNSADAAAAMVDVYVNGTMFLNDVEFRTASPFVDAPAGVPLNIVVAPGNSTSAADGIYTTAITLTSGAKYVIVASGIVSTTGYAPNQPFELFVYDMAREEATSAGNTDVLVFHGSTDAPMIDAVEPGVGVAVNDISYGEFMGYLELDNDDYMLNITTANNSTLIQGYSVPLDLLNLDGEAITILASGFLVPANNSNGATFGLWAALPGGGDLLQLPLDSDVARVQVIHNSADVSAATIDLYVNDDIYLDDVDFRTATPFFDAPAGLPLTITIAPGNSTSAADGLFTKTIAFQNDETYVVVANGILSSTGYTPNEPFDLYVFPTAREEASIAANTDVLVFHGATDAPTIDVVAQGEGTIVSDLSYGEFQNYISLVNNDYIITVTSADGNTTVETYSAPLETLSLTGEAITVLASGFLNQASNSNGSAFGLWAALPTGGDLVELPLGELSTVKFDTSAVSVYPNPSSSLLNIAIPDGYSDVIAKLYDVSGRNVLTAKGTAINISGLNSGIYMMNITIDGTTVIKKIVKE